MSDQIRATFWVLSLGVIAGFAFFAVLGAFTPSDAAGAFVAVAILCALWVVHAWLQHRHARDAIRDARLSSARERRGF